MSDTKLTYTTLRTELRRRVFRYTFSGPLLLVWSLGLIPFLAVFGEPGFALLWSGAMVALGALMAADALRTPKVHERLIRAIVHKRFRAHELTDVSLKAVADNEVKVFGEIAVKVYQIERKRGPDAHLRRLVPLTHSMVSLLWDSAREAEELERGLNLTNSSKPEGGALQPGKPEAGPGASRRQESIEDTRREVDQARSSVNDIVQHLETLMLRVFQAEQLPRDSAHSSELARDTEEAIARLIRQAESRRADRYVPVEVRQTREALEAGFSQINSSEGLSALQRLVYEYAQLQPLVERKRATDSIAFAHIPLLIEETYRAGLGLLHDALELMQAVHPSERHRLEAEVLELEKRVETLRTDRSQAERAKLMEATMSSHLERLDIMQKQQLRIEELLHLSGRCEASLHRTRMELAALKAADSESRVGEATDSLRRTIDQAREVQEEMKKLGF
jgi:hypothetical protein